MGFQRQRKLYHLVFDGPEDGDLNGFECKVRGVSMGTYLELVKIQEVRDRGHELIVALADNLVWWNLEDEGVPIEPSREAVLAEDSDFITAVVNRWMQAVGGVTPPLPEGSNGGEQQQMPEAFIPMESLSANHSS
jgi:hypothetical protein